MASLNNLIFDNGDNVYADANFSLSSGVVDAMSGNDILVATTPEGTMYNTAFSIGDSLLRMGNGDDKITGDASRGYQCNGVLLGKFTTSNPSGLNMGNGDDRLTGLGSGGGAGGFGIANFGCKISMGNGNDTLTGRSAVPNLGIYNYGTIDMGTGNDHVVASGITNGGTFLLGNGDDLMEVESDGSSGGTISLGRGNDVIKGLTNGSVNGDAGRDTVLLRPGQYSISDKGSSFQVGYSLSLSGIESIGSIQGNTLSLHAGLLNIGADGSVAYL